jgi:NAD(P)-dependent dehydrogenase (short-subunit alcohol dehydrogenase family)
METVLVVGATGNIGVATVKAVLRSGRQVLAVVRNQDSAKKLFQHVGTRDGISIVEADILSEYGIQGVIEEVQSGHLPAFQHVYGAGAYFLGDLSSLDLGILLMRIQLEEHTRLLACKISPLARCASLCLSISSRTSVRAPTNRTVKNAK